MAQVTFPNTGPAEGDAPAILDDMHVEPVDPRDTAWETEPTLDYRVIFWTSAGESAEYDVFEAEDVHAAIAWADAEARARRGTYALYAKVSSRDGGGLVWLAGIDPAAAGRNFGRGHPLG
jgi:hypothetical protein